MANSYTQIHIHIIFAVKYRNACIEKTWKDRLYQYIIGIFQANNHKVLQINGVSDRIHILIGLRPHQAISSLVQNVKSESTKWIKQNKLCKSPFSWQEGYGAFSNSKSQIPNVAKYIANQEEHHKKSSFLEEYKKFLTAFEIDWQEAYIFKGLQ